MSGGVELEEFRLVNKCGCDYKSYNQPKPFINIEEMSSHTPPCYYIILRRIRSAIDCLNGNFELAFIF